MARGMVVWTPKMVNEADDPHWAFAEYTQQVLGVPYPTQKDILALRKQTKVFFAKYPHCDWHSLCRVVRWMVTHKKRVSRIYMVVDYHRKAWASGGLPELSPSQATDEEADRLIWEALDTEKDPVWRRRLLLAQSPATKREVYSQWGKRNMVPTM